MDFLQRWSPLSERATRAIGLSTGLSLLYTGLVFGYSVHPATNVSISGTLWHAFVLNVVLALGTVGIPILLWLYYDLRSPGVLLVCLLVFWHALVEFPPIGSGQGNSPGFLFVFVLAPIYVIVYGIFAGLEYWFRQRGFPISSPPA